MPLLDYEYLERNVKLYLENTQALYQIALNVSDFEIDNNEISNLTSMVLRYISKDSGEDAFPSYSEIQSLKKVVVETVKQLQEDANS